MAEKLYLRYILTEEQYSILNDFFIRTNEQSDIDSYMMEFLRTCILNANGNTLRLISSRGITQEEIDKIPVKRDPDYGKGFSGLRVIRLYGRVMYDSFEDVFQVQNAINKKSKIPAHKSVEAMIQNFVNEKVIMAKQENKGAEMEGEIQLFKDSKKKKNIAKDEIVEKNSKK